jgi:hypothetical protein
MTEYRTTKKRDEIIRYLESKFDTFQTITVWQKAVDGKRSFLVEGRFKDYNVEEGYFSALFPEHEFKKADVNQAFYFLISGQDFVFKTQLFSFQVRDEYRFLFPKEVVLRENRNYKRTYFEEKDQIKINVSFLSKNTEVPFYSICRVLNISKGGLSIVISKETFLGVDLNRRVELVGLSFFENLPNTILANVKNARIFQKPTINKSETYAIGLKFVEETEEIKVK